MSQNILPALIGALVGGVITMIGWLANYYLGRKKEIEVGQQKAKVEYIRQQIEELYAPLWGLTEQSKAVHDVALQRLPRNAEGLTDYSKFAPQDNEIFRFFNENYYLPINNQIMEIIHKKVYLLHDGILPASFTDFIRFQTLNESLYRLWREKGIDSSNVPGTRYPLQFNEDIKSALGELRREYEAGIALITKSKKPRRKGERSEEQRAEK